MFFLGFFFNVLKNLKFLQEIHVEDEIEHGLIWLFLLMWKIVLLKMFMWMLMVLFRRILLSMLVLFLKKVSGVIANVSTLMFKVVGNLNALYFKFIFLLPMI